MRIAADENTNSLVIIASNDDYTIVEGVIQKLDVQRKQVFVDAVIMELSSTDSFNFNLALHGPLNIGDNATGIAAGQFGTNSLGFNAADALSGLAVGVFGNSVDVPIATGTGESTTLSVPAFGVALQALKTNQNVNIVISNSTITNNEHSNIRVQTGQDISIINNDAAG